MIDLDTALQTVTELIDAARQPKSRTATEEIQNALHLVNLHDIKQILEMQPQLHAIYYLLRQGYELHVVNQVLQVTCWTSNDDIQSRPINPVKTARELHWDGQLLTQRLSPPPLDVSVDVEEIKSRLHDLSKHMMPEQSRDLFVKRRLEAAQYLLDQGHPVWLADDGTWKKHNGWYDTWDGISDICCYASQYGWKESVAETDTITASIERGGVTVQITGSPEAVSAWLQKELEGSEQS